MGKERRSGGLLKEANMSEKNWQFELEEYIKQGEPGKTEKSDAWRTAIGLQAVDGLKTSDYLLDTAKEHIEGNISIDEAQKRIQSYYEQRTERSEIEDEHIERLSPFTFSKCNIPVGSTITYINRGKSNSGLEVVVVDDKNVEYQGKKYSLSALATELSGSKHGVAGPRYFKYQGEWLNTIRARVEGWKTSGRFEDVWIIPCNPNYYDIVAAFDHLDVIEWSQSINTTVGDTVYIYVGEKYKSIMFKCEVIAADQYGNRSTDDYPYYKELAKDPDIRYMKLKLVDKYPIGQYPLKELKENGLTSVQGRSKATVQLMKYLTTNEV